MKLIWESIDSNHERAQVLGGWLVKSHNEVFEYINETMQTGWNWQTSLCFVPDPTHTWDIT